MAIDNRVLTGEIRLVEIVGMLEVTAVDRVKDNGSIRANQEGNGTSTTSRAGSTLSVDGDISGNNNGVSAIPGRGLDPVDGVEKSVGTTVAGINRVQTLNVGVVTKELHQDRLNGL